MKKALVCLLCAVMAVSMAGVTACSDSFDENNISLVTLDLYESVGTDDYYECEQNEDGGYTLPVNTKILAVADLYIINPSEEENTANLTLSIPYAQFISAIHYTYDADAVWEGGEETYPPIEKKDITPVEEYTAIISEETSEDSSGETAETVPGYNLTLSLSFTLQPGERIVYRYAFVLTGTSTCEYEKVELAVRTDKEVYDILSREITGHKTTELGASATFSFVESQDSDIEQDSSAQE